jgi:hypothetical protein
MPDEMIPLAGWRNGDGNTAYLDKTLRHERMDVSLDGSVTWRELFGLWLRAALFGWAFLLFFGFLWVVISASSDLGGLTFSGSQYESSGSSAGGFVLLQVAIYGSFVVFWLVFLLSKRSDPIGEWRVMLADRAPAAGSVFSQIVGRLRDRRMPIGVDMEDSRFLSGSLGNHLVLVDGDYKVYVSVFPYGTSLYLGWMMWRSRRGITMFATFVADTLLSMLGRLDSVNLMLRTERPRAMREAAHALCREGLHVAVDQIDVPMTYGFPPNLPPVEPLPGQGYQYAPQPPAPQPPAPQPPAPQPPGPDEPQ